jgi:hypothetical protein
VLVYQGAGATFDLSKGVASGIGGEGLSWTGNGVPYSGTPLTTRGPMTTLYIMKCCRQHTNATHDAGVMRISSRESCSPGRGGSSVDTKNDGDNEKAPLDVGLSSSMDRCRDGTCSWVERSRGRSPSLSGQSAAPSPVTVL